MISSLLCFQVECKNRAYFSPWANQYDCSNRKEKLHYQLDWERGQPAHIQKNAGRGFKSLPWVTCPEIEIHLSHPKINIHYPHPAVSYLIFYKPCLFWTRNSILKWNTEFYFLTEFLLSLGFWICIWEFVCENEHYLLKL